MLKRKFIKKSKQSKTLFFDYRAFSNKAYSVRLFIKFFNIFNQGHVIELKGIILFLNVEKIRKTALKYENKRFLVFCYFEKKLNKKSNKVNFFRKCFVNKLCFNEFSF